MTARSRRRRRLSLRRGCLQRQRVFRRERLVVGRGLGLVLEGGKVRFWGWVWPMMMRARSHLLSFRPPRLAHLDSWRVVWARGLDVGERGVGREGP